MNDFLVKLTVVGMEHLEKSNYIYIRIKEYAEIGIETVID